MKSIIMKCPKCGKYTMDSICPQCNVLTVMAIPMKYSPVDKFQKYRIKIIEDENNGKNYH
ncbi:MAG: RNA-protein complex protein Nop10 [Ferroplasma sp.]